ncbi:MAG: hypothetical protein Q9219_007143 [cf. Caloplaca sp. 3 TL-2023]
MGVEEALQSLTDRLNNIKREETEQALAAGFSTLEEYKEHQGNEWQLREDERVKEQCAARHISTEQYYAELYRDHPQAPAELPMRELCDCEEHPFDFFCHQSLISYKSQDLPDMMEYLNSRHCLRPEELKVQAGERSKRLDQKSLERYWIQRPEETTIEIPFWAKADGVVRQILRQQADQDAPISPSPTPPRTPSLLYDDPMSNSPSAENTLTTSMDTSMELESTDHVLNDFYHRGATQFEDTQSDHSTNHEKRMLGDRKDKPNAKRPRAIMKGAGPRASKGARITKAYWKPAMGVRSRKVSKFYELGCDGIAIPR